MRFFIVGALLVSVACKESAPAKVGIDHHCAALGDVVLSIEQQLSGPHRGLALAAARMLRAGTCAPVTTPSLTGCSETGDPQCVDKRLTALRTGHLMAGTPHETATIDVHDYCIGARVAAMEAARINRFAGDDIGWAAMFATLDLNLCGIPSNSARLDCYFQEDIGCIRSSAAAVAEILAEKYR